MKGKRKFTENEANQIRKLINQKVLASKNEQKQIRNQIRDFEFYFSDFSPKKGYTIEDFEELIRKGEIKITDSPETNPKLKPSGKGIKQKNTEKKESNKIDTDMEESNIEKARAKYKPATIKYLLVAETPPKSDSKRFFYFENVQEQDSLFLETMKVLYPEETGGVDTKVIRSKKKELLERFSGDGFYLIDSLDTPFEEELSPSQKVNLIRAGQEVLLKKSRN